MTVKSENINNSLWIDPDDASELTENDFAQAQWFKGDSIVSQEEGKAFFQAMLSNAVNTPLEYDIVEYFKDHSGKENYIGLINKVLRQFIEHEQKTRCYL